MKYVSIFSVNFESAYHSVLHRLDSHQLPGVRPSMSSLRAHRHHFAAILLIARSMLVHHDAFAVRETSVFASPNRSPGRMK